MPTIAITAAAILLGLAAWTATRTALSALITWFLTIDQPRAAATNEMRGYEIMRRRRRIGGQTR